MTRIFSVAIFSVMLMSVFIGRANGEDLCASSCIDVYKTCRQVADNRAATEAGFMPLGGTTNPAPNANPFEARHAYQAEVQKRKVEQHLQCDAQKNSCMRACSAENNAPRTSVIFK
ncbi:MAG: hypothetical protein RL358_643 [Pseudomonadota bacterium]|jgi:hypothetical protein